MGWFFLALIGLVFLAVRAIRDSALDAAVKSREENYKNVIESLRDKKLEDYMRQKTENKSAARWDMLKEIPEKELIYVFGTEWKNLFTNERDSSMHKYSSCNCKMESVWEVAFNIWLSTKHLISYHYHKGYSYRMNLFGYHKDPDILNERIKQSRRILINACKIIEKNIMETNPNAQLFIDPIEKNTDTFVWSFWLDLIGGISDDRRIKPWGLISY